MKACRICKRILKHPQSVKLGIGPVCRARDSLQKEFDFMNAQFEVVKRGGEGEYIFIRDTGHDKGCRSITNDAEYVVEQLYVEEDITDETRIFYEDSDECIDELLHAGRVFKGFKPGHEGVEL